MVWKDELERHLLEKFGPLITLDQLAQILHRQPGGLSWALSQETDFSAAINSTKTKLGKRIYFKVGPLAAVLSDGGMDG